ncbi:DNA-directed RNA polymerase beta' subunit [hydrothermal vent metagenome]|uniref:DNA-directed RNA polymerase n=1 Tax=hydrothermal vent metagenome TaxID=652676 RepID=A0A3B1BYM1_9ZZZZ
MDTFGSSFGEKPRDPIFFNAIRIRLASPEKIRSWSFGEVKKPETINYRTFKPERDGLFCAKIFGPVKDWECICGKYKRMKHKGIVCEKCGVEVILSKVRRERMGHIELASPVAHIWFFKGLPSRIGNFLDISLRDLEKIIYFEGYIIIDPGDTGLKYKQILSEEAHRRALEEHGDGAFKSGIGAEAINDLIRSIDIEELSIELREALKKTNSQQTQRKLAKRLKVIEAFKKSGNKPEWMILKVVPVIPPELRPLVPLDGGRFATSDLNDLYRRVINRNNRLKRIQELKAPDIIIRNEKRMLQEAVAALFDNGRRGRTLKGPNKRPLKSLSDMLKGKQGRFRQNLLGKRVDYSGRSVIVVGPELKFHQCGLPKKMALEMFKPFIFHKLEQKGYATTIRSAKKMVDQEYPEVWEVLDEVVEGHPVLLNRAPTLHRLGIQAFMPVLVEGKAIRLHPLVCAAFNADFDGDQMAVHIPLSLEAQVEAKLFMMSVNNILSPAHGKPIAVPSQDIVLGCYYLTKEKGGSKGENKAFSDVSEVMVAYDNDEVDLNARIRVRVDGEVYDTTVGRVLLYTILPKGMAFEKANKLMLKKSLQDLVYECFTTKGRNATVKFLDDLKDMGFHIATIAGISISMDNMLIPDNKVELVDKAREDVAKVDSQYHSGLITHGERYNKIIDIWAHVSDTISHEMFKTLERQDEKIVNGSSGDEDFNSIFIMAESGARGSRQQIRQLAGMRGLMAKPSGEIMETPITANFREGLSVLQYFISTHGARKGLADTALKTANSGYLTRRLVDVAQDIIILEEDCGTLNGIDIYALIEGGKVIQELGERILGRTALEDVIDPFNDEVLLDANEEIGEETVKLFEERGIEHVKIRSVLTCEAKDGVCIKCYGRNLASGDTVEMGEAVGVIAAQSIGEPGTQLTMRTFHLGGTASRDVEQAILKSKKEGIVKFVDIKQIKSVTGEAVVMNRNGGIIIQNDQGRELERHRIVYSTILKIKDGDRVKEGDILAEWDPYTMSILTEVAGTVAYGDIVENVTMREEIDDTTGHAEKVILDHREEKKQPRISIKDENGKTIGRYMMPAGAHLDVIEGQAMTAGGVLAKIPRESTKTKDITGGLPRVAELFEARKPHEQATITEVNGVVKFGGIVKGMRKVIVTTENGEEHDYLVPRGKHVNVHEGDYIRAGEALVDGAANPHDILAVLGEKELQKYLVNEVQEVYRLQGVTINDKHIEVIARQMLRHLVIESTGDTDLMIGETVSKTIFARKNREIVESGGEPAKGRPILLGITKSSLSTESFISAASFQETTRVLTEVSVSGKLDMLKGLKENVIMGRLIPAGTGARCYSGYTLKVTDIPQFLKKDVEEAPEEGDGETVEVVGAEEQKETEASEES